VDLGDGWLDWLAARTLLNKATELITDSSESGKKSSKQQGETCPPSY